MFPKVVLLSNRTYSTMVIEKQICKSNDLLVIKMFIVSFVSHRFLVCFPLKVVS